MGTPYSTHKWQLHDDTRCNGRYKAESTKAKSIIQKAKIELHLPRRFEPTDIAPIVNIAWNNSFAIQKNIKKALGVRGFNPSLAMDSG